MNSKVLQKRIIEIIDNTDNFTVRKVEEIEELLRMFWRLAMNEAIPNVPDNKKNEVCNLMTDFIDDGIKNGYFTSNNMKFVLKLLARVDNFRNIEPGNIYGQMTDVGHDVDMSKTFTLNFNFEGDFLKHIVYHELSHAVTPKLCSSTTPFGKVVKRKIITQPVNNSKFKLKKPVISNIREFKFSNDLSVIVFVKELIGEGMATELDGQYVKERSVHQAGCGLKSNWKTPYNANYQQIGDEFLQTLSFINTPENDTWEKRVHALSSMAIDTAMVDGRLLERVEDEYKSKNPSGWKEDLEYIGGLFKELLTHRDLSKQEVNKYRSVISKYKVQSKVDVSTAKQEDTKRFVKSPILQFMPKRKPVIANNANAQRSVASGARSPFSESDYSDELIPGTNIRRPRFAKVGETRAQYLEFLEKYYSYYFPNGYGNNKNIYSSFLDRYYNPIGVNKASKPVIDNKQGQNNNTNNNNNGNNNGNNNTNNNGRKPSPKLRGYEDILNLKDDSTLTDTDFVEKQDGPVRIDDSLLTDTTKKDATPKKDAKKDVVVNDTKKDVVPKKDVKVTPKNEDKKDIVVVNDTKKDLVVVNNTVKDLVVVDTPKMDVPFTEEDYSDELIPGTNIKRPRCREIYETDEEYVAFLERFYNYYFPKKECPFTEEDYSDELIPGTNIKRPRCRGIYETDEEYVAFLERFYNYYFPESKNTKTNKNNKVLVKVK